MDITLEELEALAALSRSGTFTGAAETLCITQSALSHRILKLERHCQQTVVTREKPVRLTAAGETLLQYADGILALLQDADLALRDLGARAAAGHVRVAASSAWGFYVLPPALSDFYAAYPDIDVELVAIENSHGLVDAILHEEADVALGIIGEAIKNPHIDCYNLMTDEWFLISSPENSDFRGLNDVPASLLSGKRVIMRERKSGTRAMLESIFVAEDVRPAVVLEFSSTEAVKKAVEHNLGVSLIAGVAIAHEVEIGVLNAHRFAGRSLTFPYYAATARNRYLSRATREFLTWIREMKRETGRSILT